MRIVVALGGNALLRRGEPVEAANQRANVAVAAAALAEVATQHEIVLTHGNGPQVGLLALQGEAYPDVAPYPLDVLGAETEGMIGYLLEQELRNALGDRERELDFAEGSMGPKVQAACRFVEATGGIAGIGRLQDAAAIVSGRAGTWVSLDPVAGGG